MKHLTLILLLTSACSSSPAITQDTTRETQGAQRWDEFSEKPSSLLPGATVRLGDIITTDDVGNSFGVEDARIPYPDTYWPFEDGGIDADWNDDASPLQKYMAMVDPASAATASEWERKSHGKDLPGVESWWGHCPGWTAAALDNKPVLHPVDARFSGGQLVSCAQGEAGCMHFEIGDINALMAEVWVDVDSRFLGARCDTEPSAIARDEFGRIVGGGDGCKGLNAGALMVVLGNRLKREKLPFALNAQDDTNTNEIWNQPAYRYRVYRFRHLDAREAALVVTHMKSEKYQWNDDARGFVFVDVGIDWVTEMGPNRTVVSGAESTNEMRFTAVLELDAEPSNPAANIIGGEYVDDEEVGATRLTVPPFVWVSLDSNRDDLPFDFNANQHNPYVKFSLVKQLARLGAL